jgi:hypothetical protein
MIAPLPPSSPLAPESAAEIIARGGQITGSAGVHQVLLALIGELNLNWSNNESLFIYIIKALLYTDDASAAIVFATLNTTRSRLDLISRLARIKLKGSPLQRELKEIVQAFLARTRFRNELSHATFISTPSGDITHTLSTKLDERGGALVFGTRRSVDHQRTEEIAQEITVLKSLNLRIWALIAALNQEGALIQRGDPRRTPAAL